MNINIKYFGMIAETTGIKEETIELSINSNLNNLKDIVFEKYTALEDMSFNIALNHSLQVGNIELNENDEIAFLPPFAGG
jgi:molybdopterin converting factor subunit 1